jgi:hypothetical protein
MDQEIIPADRRLRLVLSVVVVVAMLAAAAFYWQFSRELQDLARTDVQAAIARVAQVRWLTLGSVVVAVLASISLAVSAVRAVRADRFPPPGARVLRDTPVLHGAPARNRAYLLLAAALGIVAAAAAVHLLFVSFLATLAA